MYSSWAVTFITFLVFSALQADPRLSILQSLRENSLDSVKNDSTSDDYSRNFYYDGRRYANVEQIPPLKTEISDDSAVESGFTPDNSPRKLLWNGRRYVNVHNMPPLRTDDIREVSDEFDDIKSPYSTQVASILKDAARKGRSAQRRSTVNNHNGTGDNYKINMLHANSKRYVRTNDIKNMSDFADAAGEYFVKGIMPDEDGSLTVQNWNINKELSQLPSQRPRIVSQEDSKAQPLNVGRSFTDEVLLQPFLRAKKDESSSLFSVSWSAPQKLESTTPIEQNTVVMVRDAGLTSEDSSVSSTEGLMNGDGTQQLSYQVLDPGLLQQYNDTPVVYRMQAPPLQMPYNPMPVATLMNIGLGQVLQPMSIGQIPNQSSQVMIPGQNQLPPGYYQPHIQNSPTVPNSVPPQYLNQGLQQALNPGPAPNYDPQALNPDTSANLYRISPLASHVPAKKYRDEAILLTLRKPKRQQPDNTQGQSESTTQHSIPIHDYDYNTNAEYNYQENKALGTLENLLPEHTPVRKEVNVSLAAFSMPPITLSETDILNYINNSSSNSSSADQSCEPADNQTLRHNETQANTTAGPPHPQHNTKQKGSDIPTNASKVLLKIMNELEEIKLDRNIAGGKEGLPCHVDGSWVSDVAGIRLDMMVMPNGSMSVHVANRVPPKGSGLLTCSWTFQGEAPFQRSGLFSIFAKNPVTKRLATFLGQCRVCGGSELVTGMWLIAREPRDCRDTHLSVTQHPDVFRREMLHLLKNKKLREIGTSSSTQWASTTTPTSQSTMAASSTAKPAARKREARYA